MNEYNAGICLLEDDPIMGESLNQFFELENLPCDWFRTLGEARTALRQRRYCSLISDVRLPDGNGTDLYRELAADGAVLPPTLFITAYGTVDQAVELLKQGARDYITKPFEPDELMVKLHRACPALFEKTQTERGSPVLGLSPAMRQVERTLERVAQHLVPVLITGESGVGKEYAARYLHSCREAGNSLPFIAFNCAAIPANLAEAELFGAERGAFTGAVNSRQGLFEQAGTGSLFLDEVGEMPLDMQAKLLRAVQERRIRRVGGNRSLPVEAQLIWATNCDLQARVEKQRFREDLYFRMSTVLVEIPPLRDRPEDIFWFTENFLEAFARENGRQLILSPAAQHYLEVQNWPGNVRELRQVVERACIFNETGILEPENFCSPAMPEPSSNEGNHDLRQYLCDCERWYVRQALKRCNGGIGEAAATLGISRKNLWERMNRLQIGRPDPAQGVQTPRG